MEYGIWCEVSGGVTGYRASWLKSENGDLVNFCNLNAAATRAAQLNAGMNHNNSRANFHYTPRATG